MNRTKKAVVIALAAAGLAAGIGGAVAASGGSGGAPDASAPAVLYHG